MLASACALDMNGLGPLSDADAGNTSVAAADDGGIGPEDAAPLPPDGQAQAGDDGATDAAAVSPPFDATHAAPDARAPDAAPAALDAAPDTASAGGPDATSNAGPDATPDAGPNGAADAEAEAGPPCDADAGCIVVPDGWMLVAFATTQTAPCPAGFDQQSIDVEESPNVSDACVCGPSCIVETTPSCSSGPIQVLYDSSPFQSAACASEAASLSNDLAGACNMDVPPLLSSATHVEFDPSPPTGGSCMVAGEVVPDRVTASEGRSCLPDDPTSAQCIGDVCTPQIADPYAPCIARTGQWDCPPGPLGAMHLVGTSLSISCGDCPCTLTGTCSGTLTFYADPACRGDPWVAQADSTCGPSPATAAAPPFQSYEYTGGMAQGLECQSSGSQIESLTLEGSMTICCAL